MQTGDALQMLFKGEQIRPLMARNMGLVHEVAPRDEIVETAKDWIKAGGSAVAPWDQKDFKLPSEQGLLAGRHADLAAAPTRSTAARRRTTTRPPAPSCEAVYQGLQLPMDLALKVESRWFAKILRSKEAAAMIRTLFVSMQELNKGARRPEGRAADEARRRSASSAPASWARASPTSRANAGIEVVLVDRDMEAAEKGKAYSHKLMSDQIMKGRAKTADRDALLARITPSADYADLKDCDLVIEAVFEDPKVKAEVDREGRGRRSAPTRSSPPTPRRCRSPASPRHSKRPDEFIGIHFFSPVEKMMLVEIIMGKETGDKALATALDYVRAIKKTPIVVNDSRGFFANRCVARLHPRRPSHARRGRAAGDDRECRASRRACRSARCRSTTRSASTSA